MKPDQYQSPTGPLALAGSGAAVLLLGALSGAGIGLLGDHWNGSADAPIGWLAPDAA